VRDLAPHSLHVTGFAPETAVDGYRVKRLVAEGAMGEVYLALDEKLGRRVALKFIKAQFDDPRALDTFLAEARVTARFSHPHIVTLYAAGVFQGRPYLALEYLDGETLRERLDLAGLPPREALRTLRAIAEAVAEAHRHGVVHADLKPENVLLPKDGRLRVVDFGLSRLVGTKDASAGGTPAYMAPERWRAAPPTPAIDVWSLGIMLFEVLEGRRPMDEQALAAFAFTPKSLALPESLETHPAGALTRACLSLDPAARPSAEEVAQQLSLLLDGGARPSAELRSPFRGLEAFSEADTLDFFGRDAEVDALVERLRSEALVPVVGPSGVGKSSLLRAGLVPRLREGGAWVIVPVRPGRRPLVNLAAALLAVGKTPSSHSVPPVDRVEALAAELETSPGALRRALREISTRTQARVLLLVDQLEELFTLAPAEQVAAFAQTVSCGAADEPWRTVVSLRDDFLGAFAAVEPFRAVLSAVAVVRPLNRAALEEAVVGPLRRVGYRTDAPTLPGRIASELRGQPAALPLLQFACQKLWDRRDPGQRLLLQGEYEAMGGATGALAAHAQELVSELVPEDRALARTLFLKLLTAEGTRRPRPREDLLEGLAPGAAALLDRLLERRLLVSGRQNGSSEAMVELAHESLVTTWPQLSKWLAETREARQLVDELEDAAQRWSRRGRLERDVWSGDVLRVAQQRVTEWQLVLGVEPRAFLEASATREAKLQRARRSRVVTSLVVLSALLLGSTTAAFAFREKQLQAIAQQEEIRLASGDIGQFELILEPFDVDEATEESHPVDAAQVPNLEWAFFSATRDDVPKVGEPFTSREVTRSTPWRDAQGRVHEVVSAPSRGGFLRFRGRGRGRTGETCSESWLRVARLPGYIERAEHKTVAVSVPTCQASHAGMIEIPAGPFNFIIERDDPAKCHDRQVDLPTFFIARTETSETRWKTFGRMAAVTGIKRQEFPAFMQGNSNLPVAGIRFYDALDYCRYLGLRLPTLEEWQKAARGGLWLDAARSHANPLPRRVFPWGNEEPKQLPRGLEKPPSIGSWGLDKSPYGVVDLAASMTEFTSSPAEELEGYFAVAGANFAVSQTEQLHRITTLNARNPEMRELAFGVRCVLEL
jgi:formylglycine-generating enzyme required for sulfatase activity/tRNA A-37 threonylcarbamoyl transferase component Bud32